MATLAGAQTQERVSTGSAIWSWITTIDHKRIGVLYFVTSLFYFLVGGLEALLIRLQLARPDGTILDTDTYNQLFTMHGTAMVFMVAMPMAAAFFNFLIPLMIGARDVAFPRLNAFSYWTFLGGSLFMHSSFLFGQAPDGGWFGYANLTSKEYTPGLSIDFWGLGLLVLGVASVAAALNFIITIINLRAPGMTMMRMPVFVWMTFVTSFLIIFAFPAITAALIFLEFDRLFGTNFYEVAQGGDPMLWQHLFWVFGHPEVYILVLPGFGIASEILPTFSRKPIFGYSAMVFAAVAIGFLGFSVWAHHMFTTGMGTIADAAFAGSTMLIAIPTGIKMFNWVATCFGGRIKLTTPMLFALGFLTTFLIGGLTGPMLAAVPLDLHFQDTYFVVGHFHYVLFGGLILALMGGVYYWYPKITGRLMSEKIGKWHFWLMFLAMNLTFFPMHFVGVDGMPRRVGTYASDMGWDGWNMFITISAFGIGASVLVFLYNLVASYKKGEPAGNDPWDARTLEWAIPSPPPEHNFDEIPEITHRDQVWYDKYGDGHGSAEELSKTSAVVADHAEEGAEEHEVHMPNPSFWPLLVSAGLTIAAAGLIIHLAVSILGVAWTVIAIYAWSLEPASDPPAEH
jgi:cytochrome c oxidase subunit 1